MVKTTRARSASKEMGPLAGTAGSSSPDHVFFFFDGGVTCRAGIWNPACGPEKMFRKRIVFPRFGKLGSMLPRFNGAGIIVLLDIAEKSGLVIVWPKNEENDPPVGWSAEENC